MKKLLRHKWKKVISPTGLIKYICQKCGCVKYYDFDFDCTMYKWGTNITYRPPECIAMNGKPYNKIEDGS